MSGIRGGGQVAGAGRVAPSDGPRQYVGWIRAGRFGRRRRVEVGSLLAVPRGRSWPKRDGPRRAGPARPPGVLLVAPHLKNTASRRGCPGRSAQARNSDVFPLPAGAEMTVTCFAAARSRAARRLPRSISQGVARATRPAYVLPATARKPDARLPVRSVLRACSGTWPAGRHVSRCSWAKRGVSLRRTQEAPW